MGRHAAEEPLDELKEALKDARVVFTIASIGGDRHRRCALATPGGRAPGCSHGGGQGAPHL